MFCHRTRNLRCYWQFFSISDSLYNLSFFLPIRKFSYVAHVAYDFLFVFASNICFVLYFKKDYVIYFECSAKTQGSSSYIFSWQSISRRSVYNVFQDVRRKKTKTQNFSSLIHGGAKVCASEVVFKGICIYSTFITAMQS